MIMILFSLVGDIANYYKNLNELQTKVEVRIYKSKLNRIQYVILGNYYENKDKTIYYGYLPNGSKVKMEFFENNYTYYLNDNVIETGSLEIPIFSPYKMFIFLYENSYPYNLTQKDSILYISFNTDGNYWFFKINSNDYKILEYTPPHKLKIDFK